MNGQMEKPMGWYKFLVYAGAFLAAGWHIVWTSFFCISYTWVSSTRTG